MTDILLIEDDLALNELISSVLEMHDINVIRATSKESCFESVPLNPPKMCIIDLSLPDTTGTDLAQLLIKHYKQKTDEEKRDLAIVFISAMHEKELPKDVSEIIDQHRFMQKPFQLAQLALIAKELKT